MTRSIISSVRARRIWDSRGRPTIEVEIRLQTGHVGIGAAPAGASRGEHEAVEIRDGGDRLGGWDVQRAIGIVRERVAPALVGIDIADGSLVDAALDRLDPTPTRSTVGGNVSVATSFAALRVRAAFAGEPVWRYIAGEPAHIPRPEVQIIGGGVHAGRVVEVQDFMVVPLTATTIDEALCQVAEVYLQTGLLLADRTKRSGVADEGGHWPIVETARGALEVLTNAIDASGLVPGIDMGLSLDIAASEFFVDGRYVLASESRRLEPDEWIDELCVWVDEYPIVAIEDPVESNDDRGMREIVTRLGKHALIVGDDYMVTSANRIRRAADEGTATAALIKPNQAGTVTAAHEAHEAARLGGMATIVSARSGETEDTTVADLATGWGADIIKVGSIARGERTAKWNHLIRIADGSSPVIPLAAFPNLGTPNADGEAGESQNIPPGLGSSPKN